VLLIKETAARFGDTHFRTNCDSARLVGWDGGIADMGAPLMHKTIYAVAVAALIAGGLTLAPSLSWQVEAGASPPADVKADRADFRPPAGECSEKAWPYMEASCLRDARNPYGQAREVRFVPLDNAQRPADKALLAKR